MPQRFIRLIKLTLQAMCHVPQSLLLRQRLLRHADGPLKVRRRYFYFYSLNCRKIQVTSDGTFLWRVLGRGFLVYCFLFYLWFFFLLLISLMYIVPLVLAAAQIHALVVDAPVAFLYLGQS